MPRTAGRSLVIASAIRRALVRQARNERPFECCGFLIGSGRRIVHAVPMVNISRSPTRYEIDPAAHIELRRLLRRFAPPISIVGIYHSHPAGGGTPSPTDIEEAMYPAWVYAIVALGARRAMVRAFRIARGRVTELAIRWH
jgi:proteasome lid subunit RPN8/RPN11